MMLLPLLLFASVGSIQSPSGPKPDILAQLRSEAAAVRPLVETELSRKWLDRVGDLKDPGTRVLISLPESGEVISEEEFAARRYKMPPKHTRTELPSSFYYMTRYGTPLAYVRVLDVAAKAGLSDLKGKSVLDFGYGGTGHLRMTASMGARVVGIEVDPVLKALYSAPGDVGKVGT
ncbi:MAG TPA: hypothetical protein VEX38_03400, partial [Fimbriimonadaceae bacterium]|nr:hypothetical protein [Fimbriimonadaceae bacterium]